MMGWSKFGFNKAVRICNNPHKILAVFDVTEIRGHTLFVGRI
jgi:hypothetical protein